MLLNMLKAVRSILAEPSPDAVKCAVKILDEIIACQEPTSQTMQTIVSYTSNLDKEAQQAQEEILGQ
jgi:hypothetical protein